MQCSNGACSLTSAPKKLATKSFKKVGRAVPRQENYKPKTNNCATCNSYEDSHPKVSFLAEKIHEKKGHACEDDNCNIKKPHAHIHNHKHVHGADSKHGHDNETEHVHGPSCNHQHGHEKIEVFFKPLELVINESKMPQWLKQLSLNLSFLTPALVINGLLRSVKIPSLLKTLTSIAGMHFTNRGTNKLARLGLTALVATAASGDSFLAKHSSGIVGTDRNLSRFIATSLVAIIEKFSGNGHFVKFTGKSFGEKIINEYKVFSKNILDPKQWKELLPGLLNVEAKVQIIVPLVNKLISRVTENLSPSSKQLVQIIFQALATSLSFVGFDQVLQGLGMAFGKGSAFASMVPAMCGCCGSPVCAAAATDSALQNTL